MSLMGDVHFSYFIILEVFLSITFAFLNTKTFKKYIIRT